MNKKIVIIPIILITIILGLLFNQIDKKPANQIFHITLANPDLYENGVYFDTFFIDKGEYIFKFVPNGDSPKSLIIHLKGVNYNFSENFKLKGILHKTGISEYYTWEYDGQKEIQITSQQILSIEINPNGDELGSVSVDIIKN